jgi:hypothetical protein
MRAKFLEGHVPHALNTLAGGGCGCSIAVGCAHHETGRCSRDCRRAPRITGHTESRRHPVYPGSQRARWWGRVRLCVGFGSVAVVVACATGHAPSPPPAATGSASAPVAAPRWAPVTPQTPGGPSFSARQVCDPNDGQKDIAAALGGMRARVDTPTWVDHLYSCRYNYPNGSFVLSVKELATDTRTTAYVDQLIANRGRRDPVPGLGEGAVYTSDGSMIVRKDNKVLLVDVSGLPAQFSQPPLPRAAVSRIIATVIMGCWNGD